MEGIFVRNSLFNMNNSNEDASQVTLPSAENSMRCGIIQSSVDTNLGEELTRVETELVCENGSLQKENNLQTLSADSFTEGEELTRVKTELVYENGSLQKENNLQTLCADSFTEGEELTRVITELVCENGSLQKENNSQIHCADSFTEGEELPRAETEAVYENGSLQKENNLQTLCADSFIEDSVNCNNGAKDEQQSQLKRLMCKVCNKPNEMQLIGNLIIKGFCNNCSEKVPDNIDSDCSSVSLPEAQFECQDEAERVEEQSNIILLNCLYCSKSFRFNKALNEHLKSRSSGKYGCNFCEEKFCNLHDLSEHTTLHAEEKVRTVKLENWYEGTEEMEPFTPVSCKKTVLSEGVLTSTNTKSKREFRKAKMCVKQVNGTDCKSTPKRYTYCSLCNIQVPINQISEHMNGHVASQSHTVRRKTSLNSETSANDLSEEPSVKREVKKKLPTLLYSYNYNCELCDEDLSSIESLNLHLTTDKHANHIVFITGINLSCRQCKELFNSINELKTHVTSMDHIIRYHVKQKEIVVFNCTHCDKTFINEADMTTHKYFHVNTNEQVMKISKLDIASVNNKENTGTPNRGQSQNEYTHNKGLSVKLIDCSRNRDKFLDDSVKYTCKLCNKHYKHINSLRRHEMLHNRTDKYTCVKCSAVFSSITALRRHATSLRHPIRPDLMYKSLKVRNQHKGSSFRKSCNLFEKCAKNGDVPLDCRCGATFTDEGDFMYHILAEKHFTADKPKVMIRCIHCKTTYEKLSSFLRHTKRRGHLLAHIQEVIINDTFCEICDNNINTDKVLHVTSYKHIGMFVKLLFKSDRNNNMIMIDLPVQSHKSKSIISSKVSDSVMKMGTMTHTQVGNTRQVVCHICNCVFQNRRLLKKHKRCTHDPKRYSCNKCKKQFVYRDQLRSHLKMKCTVLISLE